LKRVLLYYQHLKGIGHVKRSWNLARELAKSSQLTLVQGGPPPSLPPPDLRLVQLDPLLLGDGLYDPFGRLPVKEVFLRRRAVLRELAREPFDLVIVELFPFGRRKFAAEILFLLEEVRRSNPAVRFVSSVRDILVEREKESVEESLELSRRFEQIWVHSDPRLIPWELADSLENVRYTGFVSEGNAPCAGPREKRILVSAGGGGLGEEIYRAAAAVAGRFPDFVFHFVLGPFSRAGLGRDIQTWAGGRTGLEISGLLPDFEAELCRSSLSLSMAGYNTVMNLVSARCPALVFPFSGDREQRIRAEAFGLYLGMLRWESLEPPVLEKLMRERMATPYPKLLPDLNGAARARELLESL
jgi:predicted glycosyltransferase